MDRFIPSRHAGIADALSPASALSGASWSRATATPRRRGGGARLDSAFGNAEGASAVTWVVGAANDSAGRPGPIVHAAVLREELLGGRGVGGGGGVTGDAALPLGSLDITSGWNDVSVLDAPESVSAGSSRYPVPPRLAAAAAAAAATTSSSSTRAAALSGSPARAGGHLLLARDEDDFLGGGGAGWGVKENEGGVRDAVPLDGTSHWGVSTASLPHATASGHSTPRVLQFHHSGGMGGERPSTPSSSSSSSSSSSVYRPSQGQRHSLGPLVSLGSRSEALLASPPLPKRRIAHVPYKVLDAPALADDFYLNLLDWGAQNVVAVGLDKDVYLWNGFTTNVTKLASLPDDAVTSVRWAGRGAHLVVGSNKGIVQLWDATTSKELRTLNTHKQRVGVTAWSGPLLATGSRDKSIHLVDVRSRKQVEMKLSGHKHEICGLEWSPDGSYLASGGNDNNLCIWSAAKLSTPLMSSGSSSSSGGGGGDGGGDMTDGESSTTTRPAHPSPQPLHRFQQHTAAVKALAWCPHKSGLLASGGGTADKCIRFWNASTGLQLGAVDTGSQVCQLAWSPSSPELLSAHGYSTNTLVVWRFPSMSRVATLTGHTTRVLYMTLAPDGESVCTGAGDETIRFWRIFGRPPWITHSTADTDSGGNSMDGGGEEGMGRLQGAKAEKIADDSGDLFSTLLSDLPSIR